MEVRSGGGRLRLSTSGTARKWCYMSNVSNYAGGRMSNRCFTPLRERHGRVLFRNQLQRPRRLFRLAGVRPRHVDATRPRSHPSRPHGHANFHARKRNHPKTGDPMLSSTVMLTSHPTSARRGRNEKAKAKGKIKRQK